MREVAEREAERDILNSGGRDLNDNKQKKCVHFPIKEALELTFIQQWNFTYELCSGLDSSHELDLNQYFRATCLLVDREWVCRPPRIEWNIRPVAEFSLVTNDPAKLTCRPYFPPPSVGMFGE